jgi:hypothetical protein
VFFACPANELRMLASQNGIYYNVIHFSNITMFFELSRTRIWLVSE